MAEHGGAWQPPFPAGFPTHAEIDQLFYAERFRLQLMPPHLMICDALLYPGIHSQSCYRCVSRLTGEQLQELRVA